MGCVGVEVWMEDVMLGGGVGWPALRAGVLRAEGEGGVPLGSARRRRRENESMDPETLR